MAALTAPLVFFLPGWALLTLLLPADRLPPEDRPDPALQYILASGLTVALIPIGLLLMLSAVIFGTKPSAPKYPGYPQYYQQYQAAGQYPPPPQDFTGQQRAYGQMYDQAYQYGYQYGYWLAMQKAAEQMYRAYRQPYQYYQQYYQYPV
ncbi:MAG: hypothetical protein QXO25_07000 [Candidatus Bathyarchaeia archaeon]